MHTNGIHAAYRSERSYSPPVSRRYTPRGLAATVARTRHLRVGHNTQTCITTVLLNTHRMGDRWLIVWLYTKWDTHDTPTHTATRTTACHTRCRQATPPLLTRPVRLSGTIPIGSKSHRLPSTTGSNSRVLHITSIISRISLMSIGPNSLLSAG